MLCPVCQQAEEVHEPVSRGDNVHVFCCERCTTGVIRVFAAHRPVEEGDEQRTAV
jgi:hypothetical protein